MRVIDCECGDTLHAANDDDLFKVAREHMDREHAELEMTDDQVRQLVAEKAYEASDS
jgi:predicted small metal-binding protein